MQETVYFVVMYDKEGNPHDCWDTPPKGERWYSWDEYIELVTGIPAPKSNGKGRCLVNRLKNKKNAQTT